MNLTMNLASLYGGFIRQMQLLTYTVRSADAGQNSSLAFFASVQQAHARPFPDSTEANEGTEEVVNYCILEAGPPRYEFGLVVCKFYPQMQLLNDTTMFAASKSWNKRPGTCISSIPGLVVLLSTGV
jgi:hypothetical protein